MTLKFRTESGSIYTVDRENDKIFVEPHGYKTTMEFDLVHCEPVTVGDAARMTYLVGEYVHLIETSEVTEILTDTLGDLSGLTFGESQSALYAQTPGAAEAAKQLAADLSGLTFGEPVVVEYSPEVAVDLAFDKEFSS